MIVAVMLGAFAPTWLSPAIAGQVSPLSAPPGPSLQEEADGLMKNVEEMMAHGGMGDAKAIIHHCGEASRLAEGMLKQLAPSDPGSQDARTALDDVVRQCRRVSERDVHTDPGTLLNPAIKARAAARDSIKALGLTRVNRS